MFRYIGNKSKLLSEIITATRNIIGETGTVVDLMAGTGSVAMEYRRQGYRVTASDVMTYSKHHLITQLLFNEPPKFNGLRGIVHEHGQICIDEVQSENSRMYLSVIEHLNQLSPIEGYFFTEFSPSGRPANGCPGRKYFTSENARKIDAIRDEINHWIASRLITTEEESVLKHTLIMAVNRIANISGTYGYYLSEFKKNSLAPIYLIPFKFENIGNTDHVILQGFAEELAVSITADLCYIDPPYMKRQYAANYHILETIARGDFPEAIGKSGLRDWWDQHSKLCTKTRSTDSFKKIVGEMNCSNFLISYSEDGLLSIKQLVGIFEEFGPVRVNEIDYMRFRSNQSLLPKSIKEYIIEVHKN